MSGTSLHYTNNAVSVFHQMVRILSFPGTPFISQDSLLQVSQLELLNSQSEAEFSIQLVI